MKFVLWLVLVCLAAFACRPTAPQKTPDNQKSVKKEKEHGEVPKHIAPPPAYGNKVVKK